MDIEMFQNLSTEKVAQLVREAGPKVCVFPINGTRRWFRLEYPEEAKADSPETYFQIAGRQHIKLYKLFFDHGIDTLLTPIFGPELLARGKEYEQIMVPALLWFAQNQDFLHFYDTYDVRVRIYGDAQHYLQNTIYAPALDAYEEIARRTISNQSHRLFFGVCAHDATETVAKIGLRFHQEYGRLPNKQEIIETYYGEYVEPVDFFIGFDRPTVFDMPLIATGDEDLYFTISPSPYLSVCTLRAILYDHLYTRRVDESSYAKLSPEDWDWLRSFYQINQTQVLGIGTKRNGVWYPLPQARLPKHGT